MTNVLLLANFILIFFIGSRLMKTAKEFSEKVGQLAKSQGGEAEKPPDEATTALGALP